MDGYEHPDPDVSQPVTEPLNSGRFQNHANLKVIPMATPKPRQTFKEVQKIAKVNRQKQKRLRAKARRRENRDRIVNLRNDCIYAPLPDKPTPIQDLPIVYVAAGNSVSSKDRRVQMKGAEPQQIIIPTPSNCRDDYDDYKDEWGCLSKEDGSDNDDLHFHARPSRKPFPAKYERRGLLSVDLPSLPGSTENPPPATRVTDWMFYSKDCQLMYYIISDQWLVLERSLQLRDMFRANSVQKMPKDTVADVVLSCQSTHLQGYDKERFHPFYDMTPSPGNQDVQRFIREVERTRLLCVNTEGKDQFLENGKDPRVNVTVGSFDGTVLYFNDYNRVPESIRAMFIDPKYTKIGSGLQRVIDQFMLLKERIRNWVEVGSLRMALYPPAWEMFQQKMLNQDPKDYGKEFQIGHGVDYMVVDLVAAGYYPQDYVRTKFDFKWNWKRHNFATEGKPPQEMLPHLLENVRTPFAELILIVDLFSQLRGYERTTEPFWPILYEALDLCRLKSPEVFPENLHEDRTIFNWTSRVSTGDRIDQHPQPSQCMEMLHFLSARADFVEPYLTEDLNKTAELIFHRFFTPGGIEFPSYEHMAKVPLRRLLEERCSKCGALNKPEHRCTGNNLCCAYPHDGEVFPPHSTLCCPNLHNYCRVCMTVGHSKSVHYKPSFLKTTRELRKRYLEFASQGLFTCLPFLVNHPQGRLRIAAPHWKASYDGKRYNGAVLMRYFLGVAQFVPLSLLGEERRQKEEELHREQDRKMLAAVHANACLDNTNFQPVPLDFKSTELTKARDEAKEARKTKDEMAKAAKAQRRAKEKEIKETAERRQAARERQQNENRRIILAPTRSNPSKRARLFRRN